MFEQVKISPSILSADFMHLGCQIELIERAGAGYVHVDVMDGHFVPNLTMGVPIVKQLKKITKLPLDVHLMIDNPWEQIPWFIDAGADIVNVHAEAYGLTDAYPPCESASRIPEGGIVSSLEYIRANGAIPAVTIKPNTPISFIYPTLPYVDMVLVMSVEPGFSGQSFMPCSVSQIRNLTAYCEEHGFSPLIEVDGGIGPKTLSQVVSVGADVLVCGNAVYAQDDPVFALQEIQKLADETPRY